MSYTSWRAVRWRNTVFYITITLNRLSKLVISENKMDQNALFFDGLTPPPTPNANDLTKIMDYKPNQKTDAASG